MFYSPSVNAFFLEHLRKRYERAGTWPNDAIEITEEDFQAYGQGEPPEGMQRGADENSRPAWVPIPPADLDTLAARQRAAIDVARDQAFAEGMPCDIAGEPDVVQTRPQDQTNLLGIAIEARELLAAGVTDPVITFRGLSNVNRLLTPQQAVDMANAAAAHIKAVYDQSWQRKDAIDAALADDNHTDDEKRVVIEAVEW